MTPSIAIVASWEPGTAVRRRESHMPLMRIDRWDVRSDGALSDGTLQHKVQSLGYTSIARIYPAGAVVAAQPDPRERIQAVASGLVKITIDGESAIITAGDVVFVPCDAVRRLEVIGNTAAHCLEGIPQPGPGH